MNGSSGVTPDTNEDDSEPPNIDKETLVTVYLGLLEVAEESEDWETSDVAENADLEVQQTDVVLDELAHMGLVENRDGRWCPVIT